jgi:two-component system OmpR family response regulator
MTMYDEMPDCSVHAPPADGLETLRVLVIEDQPEVAMTIRRVLDRNGMQTAWAQTGAEVMGLKRGFDPHIALVDLELPDTSGISVIQWLAAEGGCGIIVVSGHGEEADRIVGLEVGADDYIMKPPMPRELVARIRAVHRRVGQHGEPAAREAKAQNAGGGFIGRVWVDVQQRAAINADGQRIDITAAEFAALGALLDARGETVSREHLSEIALRRPWHAEDRSVDQLIFGLRQKLSSDGEGRRHIQTVRGLGYVLSLADSQQDRSRILMAQTALP